MQGDESRVISTGAGSDDGVRRFRSPGTFDPDKEDWNLYEIRFLAAIRVARVTDDADKSGLLISSLSPAVFKRLYNLLQPRNIMEVPFKDLTATLSDHFTPKRFKEFERYKLFSNRQEDGESVKDFVERLSAIISRCEYEGESDVRACSLMTAFIVGLRDQRIRARLVLEKTLTMDTAIRLAESFLAAEAESKQLHAEPSVHKVTVKPESKERCFRCGNSNHSQETCRFRNEDCHACGKTGHISKMCRSSASQGTRKKGKHFRKVKLVTDVFLADDQDGKFIACSIKDKDVILQVDTGSRATLLDERTFKRLGEPELYQSPYRLRAFNKDEIPLRGAADLDVSIGGRVEKLQALFTRMEHTNLLGRDWIRELGIDLNTLFVGKILTAPKLEGVLGTYSDLFRSQLGRCTKVLVHLHLKKDAEPKFFKPRPIPFASREAVEADLQRQVQNGVLEPIEVSEWATPIVVVPKPNGAVRVCGDFSVTVNPQIEIAQYPFPRPEELLATLNGGEKFTKLDLSEAYLQMELDEEAKKILVINTHKGLFQFNRMPFGIASAPAVFQRTMEQVIAGIPSVACYLDDIIVTGRNDKEHLETLEQVLSRLREFGFTLKREKCAFLQRQVEYLGHVVTAEGFRPSPKKVSAILNMPPPTQVSELRSFLGLVQHYGKYLPSLSDICAPLNSLLKKSTSWQWSASCVDAFETIKRKLASAEVLTHYDPRKDIFLAVDASSKGIGAVIYHRINGEDRPIAHASKTLTPAQTKYAQIEREALAIIFGVRKFHQYLWGRKFTLFTDHKPLTVIFGPSKGIPATTASRLQRWAIILMSYAFDIQFKSTTNIANADGLSRLPEGADLEFDQQMEEGIFNVVDEEINAVQDFRMHTLPVRAKQIAEATLQDRYLKQVKEYIASGWPERVEQELVPYWQRRAELTTHRECVLWGLRTVIPQKYRAALLDTLHECHVGQNKMKMLARSYLWWPGLDKDIESRVRGCDQCASVAAQEVPVPLHQWEPPDKPWYRLHADFAELHGKHYLIVIDSFSKWPDVRTMTTTTADKTIDTLRDIFTQNGLPEVFVTDNGPPFTSQQFRKFLEDQGIHHVLTPPYHPKSNGLAENFVRTFKTALRRSSGGGRESIGEFSLQVPSHSPCDHRASTL
ncbi:uncharacterized protein K02A2.6-like [Ornithodoros turicata]|uniref:uncharacterized protein K02A2.6-like n=1 Tax=Ornithodoros turicata TaxID=34597 RepID=UPI0031391A16